MKPLLSLLLAAGLTTMSSGVVAGTAKQQPPATTASQPVKAVDASTKIADARRQAPTRDALKDRFYAYAQPYGVGPHNDSR